MSRVGPGPASVWGPTAAPSVIRGILISDVFCGRSMLVHLVANGDASRAYPTNGSTRYRGNVEVAPGAIGPGHGARLKRADPRCLHPAECLLPGGVGSELAS